ncbi:hypothetical protein ScPMuIL_013459 [Solemya velum]
MFTPSEFLACRVLFAVTALTRGQAANSWLGVTASEIQTPSACYGSSSSLSGHVTFMLKSTCNASDVMAVKAVNAFAKPTSKNCPKALTGAPGDLDSVDETCCLYETGDCGGRYTSFYDHYSGCTGQDTCQLQVARDDTRSCENSEQYMQKTNYMQMEYYCIAEKHILDVCSNDVISGQAVYLWNSMYPAGQSLTKTENNCTCSVEISCKTNVDITALDIRLETADGICGQALEIREPLPDTETNTGSTITCEDNNQFVIERIHRSQTHFSTIRMDNQLDTNDGYFWIEISGKHWTLGYNSHPDRLDPINPRAS